MRLIVRAVIVIAALWCGVTASAAVAMMKFDVRHGDRTVSDARLCVFRASDEVFFGRFFPSNEMRCVDADETVALTPGSWSLFADSASVTSFHPMLVTIGSGAEAADRSRGVPPAIEVLPAAFVDFSESRGLLAEGDHFGVYLSNAGRDQSPAAGRPLPRGESRLAVPAGMPVVPLVIRKGRIIAAAEPLELKPGQQARPSGFGAIAAGVLTTIAEPRVNDARDLGAPRIVLRNDADGTTLVPLIPVRAGALAGRSLHLFRAPPGRYHAMVGGAGWKDASLAVHVGTGLVTAELPIEPAPRIHVEWAFDPRMASSRPAQRGCDDPPREDAIVLGVYDCGAGWTRFDAERCLPIERRQVGRTADSGQTSFVMPPHPERLALAIDHPAAAALSVTRVAHEQSIRWRFSRQWFAVSGTVRMNGEPIAAQLAFPSGFTASDRSGAFTAFLLAQPRQDRITVTPCGGSRSYEFLPPEPYAEGVPMVVDLVEHPVRVRVLDRARNAPAAGVRVILVSENGDELDDGAVSGEDGLVALNTIARAVKLQVCSRSARYRNACSEPFTLEDEQTVELRLEAAGAGVDGRVVAAEAIDGGRLFVVSPRGVELESAAVGRDGRFSLQRRYGPRDAVVFVGASHPMFVDQPLWDGAGALEVRRRVAAVREFSVALTPASAQERVDTTLLLDGQLVPESAFALHQLLRGVNAQLARGGATPVRDVAAQRIAVLFAPLRSALPALTPASSTFTDPHAAAFVRRVEVDAPVVRAEY